MYYNTFSDMMIDNRNGIKKELGQLLRKGNKRGILKCALEAYDFAVMKAIEHHESYKLLKAELVKEFGEEKAKEIEANASKDFLQLAKGVEKYTLDVERGKKVGYPAKS